MKPRFLRATAVASVALFVAGTAVAADSGQLGTTLTPAGGEKAGNGSDIPAWDGGICAPPDGIGFVEGKHHPSPFSSESPKFTIDSTNVDQHADKLSAGLQAMVKKWNTLKLPVYPSHRTACFPDRINEALKQNADNAKLAAGGNGVQNAVGTSPFPTVSTDDPDAGVKVMWNHILRYRGETFVRESYTAVVDPSGGMNPVYQQELAIFTFSLPGKTAADISKENIVFKYIRRIQKPARLSGTRVLVHETLDQVKESRKAWLYDDGRKRITRAPDVAYDTLEAGLGGQRTVDNVDMYNGAPDRYQWSLVGKKEMYVPYHVYGLHKNMEIDELALPGHLNPKLLRYEPHRVWVVQGKLREGQRHVYDKRVFYVDEDTWQILGYDQYDGKGQLWKVGEAMAVNYYERNTIGPTVETQYDLLDGKYVASGVAGPDGPVVQAKPDLQDKDFIPNALKRRK